LLDIEDELGVLTGRVRGINDTGELRVLVDGQERMFSSADISLGKPVEPPVPGGSC
jgi:hypothetical protein